MPLRNKKLNRDIYTTVEIDTKFVPVDAHDADTIRHITATERTSWDGKADESDLTTHTGSTSNPHAVTAAQVGLGNVDNTSDVNKPISTATQTALDGLDTRLTSHEQLGHFVGSFATKAVVPDNISGFPKGIYVNDFITVRADETQGGEPTRYFVSAINLGVIVWTYDVTLSTDISGKLDINGTAVAATKLETARTITITPSATAAASFDGTANVTPGVSVTTAAGTAANTLPAVAATALQSWLVTARNCLTWLTERFDASGNANSANKLTTARSITVTPTETAAGSFDGSANITPGVSVTTAAGTAANTLPGTAATNLQGWLVIARNCLAWLVARFDASGNANAALKLTTARTITVTPTATAAGSFDGSANITPGVSVTTAAGTAASTLPGTAATNLQGWLVICRNCLSWLTTRVAAIPSGGTTGQVLAKSSDSDWATSWQSGIGEVIHFWKGGTINVLSTSIPTAKIGDYIVITSPIAASIFGVSRQVGSVWKILTTTSLEDAGNTRAANSMFTMSRHAVDDNDLRLTTPGAGQAVMGAFTINTGTGQRGILTPNVAGATYRVALFCGETWATRSTSGAGASPNHFGSPAIGQALVAYTHQYSGTVNADSNVAFIGPTGNGTGLPPGRQWNGIYFITRANG